MGVDFEDVVYSTEYDWIDDWANFEDRIGQCLLPAIPWYKNGDVVLSQHSSILRKVAEVH